jgi:hypothetical protein
VQGAVHATVKLAVPVIGAIGSLNAAETAPLMDTPTAWFKGVTAVTVGAAGMMPVVNFQT